MMNKFQNENLFVVVFNNLDRVFEFRGQKIQNLFIMPAFGDLKPERQEYQQHPSPDAASIVRGLLGAVVNPNGTWRHICS